jgi:tetratricopeptide (TPR) repeat protein
LLRLAAILAVAATAAGAAQTSRVGDVAFVNSGAAAAQASFLYGLAQLHNFEYDDAARAFRDAQQKDPGFAMAYWGEAMTKNHPVWMEQDLGGARRILERLAPTSNERVAKAGTAREQSYMRAVEALYGSGDKPARDLAYLAEMRRLHAAYADDVDATAFYALALLGSAHGGRDFAIYMQAAAALEESFAAHPNHPGLVHYLIHSYDDPTHAPLGLRAARRYSSIAPAAPHALHMTSHIYLAAGMWDDVVAANEQATRVAAERARKLGRAPGGCGHANMWLMYGYLQQGRPADARRILDACRVNATGAHGLSVRSAEEDPLDPDNIAAGSYIQMWSRYLLDSEWDEALARDDVPLGDLAAPKLTRAFVLAWHAAWTTTDAAALRDRLAEVAQARSDLLKAIATRRDEAQTYRFRSAVLESEIRALVLRADRRTDEALKLLREAATVEDAMPVEFGPPFVDKPAHELLGDLLLADGQASEAVAEYRTALTHAPNRAASLLGLARAAARAGDVAASSDAYAQLNEIWRRAERVPDDVRAAAGGRQNPKERF